MEGNIFRWYFRRSSLPYWCILLFDSFIFLFSGIVVYYLYHGGASLAGNFWSVARVLLVYLAVSVVFYKVFHTYSGIIRFSSFVDLMRVGYANLSALIVSGVLHYAFLNISPNLLAHLYGRELVTTFVVSTLLMGAVRVLVKTVYDITTVDKRALKTLIYGAGDGGVALAKSVRTDRPRRFLLKGFIAHDKSFAHHQLMGQDVFPDDADLAAIIDREHIEAVLISPYRNEELRNNEALQDLLIEKHVKIFMVANATMWKDSDHTGTMQLNEVEVEDLLPRDEIKVDMDKVAEQLAGKNILITGSAGSIGSEMVRQIAACKPRALMLIDQAETPQHDIRLMLANDFPDIKAEVVVVSICNAERMEKIFAEFRPEYVFHAAAYKHVPMMEDNPSEAIGNNVVGTKIIADLSVKYGVKKFVMVSTDKAVNPTNVMGCSKRICEIYVQSLNEAQQQEADKESTQFVTTRFGNVLGSNGSVIPLFREQIKHGGPVTVTHPDIIRYFMLIPEACQLVLEAGTKGNGGEIFIFDMGKPVKIADLAQRMILLSGAENIEVQYTGLRAGEKLYEEMLATEEDTKPSFHDKIRIANTRRYEFDQVRRDIDELIDISRRFDDMATVKKMKEIVPEYKSNNSKYSVLD